MDMADQTQYPQAIVQLLYSRVTSPGEEKQAVMVSPEVLLLVQVAQRVGFRHTSSGLDRQLSRLRTHTHGQSVNQTDRQTDRDKAST